MRKRLVLTLAVSALALNAVACHLQIEQLLAVQDGSQMEIGILSLPPAIQPLEGGSVMNIDIRIGLLDLLLGSIDGDIEVGELLIAAPGFNFLGNPALNTGAICVVPVETDPGGGTFEANLHAHTATFDVAINTIALLGNPVLAATLPGGGFAFPFALQSEIPFGLAEMLGLLTGSGDIEITQPIDQDLSLVVLGSTITGHVGGEITLASADAFPTSPLLDDLHRAARAVANSGSAGRLLRCLRSPRSCWGPRRRRRRCRASPVSATSPAVRSTARRRTSPPTAASSWARARAAAAPRPSAGRRRAASAGLGFLSGADPYSTARGISANGSVIVGTSRGSDGVERAYRWSGGVFTALNRFGCDSCDPVTQAFGVSGNGLVAVGSALARGAGSSPIHLDPVRWPGGGTGIGDLGNLAGPQEAGEAFGASTTGAIVVGSHFSNNGKDAWRWQGSGLVALPSLTGGAVVAATAYAVSDDGTTIVGYSNQGTLTLPGGTVVAKDLQAVRWTGASFGAIQSLGAFPGAVSTDSRALAVSANGAIIVGRAANADLSTARLPLGCGRRHARPEDAARRGLRPRSDGLGPVRGDRHLGRRRRRVHVVGSGMNPPAIRRASSRSCRHPPAATASTTTATA